MSTVIETPFEVALREAHGRLFAAHSAALATVEAELQRMRSENIRLRMLLADAGLQPDTKQATKTQTTTEVVNIATVGKSASRVVTGEQTEPAPAPAESFLAPAQALAPGIAVIIETRSEIATTVTASQQPVPTTASLNASANITVQAASSGSTEQLRVPAGNRIVEKPEIIEFCTPAVAAASPPPGHPSSSSTSTYGQINSKSVDVGTAVSSILAAQGLQNLPVSSIADKGEWNIAGMLFLLRFAGQELRASSDGGHTWESFEALVMQHCSSSSAQDNSTLNIHRAGIRPQQARSIPVSSQEYVRRQESSEDRSHLTAGSLLVTPVLHADLNMELPAWRPDGMPTFNNAFPNNFDALSGPSEYYSQFRVRVPTASQYEAFER